MPKAPPRPLADPAPERPTRDREATRARILAAVGVVLARHGFRALGVNSVAKEAGVDKVLLYRYFGGMPELLREWGSSGGFWPTAAELAGDPPEAFGALPLAERYALFFERFIDDLRRRPLTLEILAAEVADRTDLTAILEENRERWGEDVARLLGEDQLAGRPEVRALTILLLGGVQYLLVRARTIRIFGGVELRSDAGWDELKTAIRKTAEALLPSTA